MFTLCLYASKSLLFKPIPPIAFEAQMKPYALLAWLVLLFDSVSLNTASAKPFKSSHSTVKSKSTNVSGVDTITPKEADDKTTTNGSGWNGSCVGVNAGTSFGATAGTNVVVPMGIDMKTES